MIDVDGLLPLLCVSGLPFNLSQQRRFQSCSADWTESWRAISFRFVAMIAAKRLLG
jgi:hypothetical protein